MITKKLFIIILFFISGFSFSKEYTAEITDLNQAKGCFLIEEENTQISLKKELIKNEIDKKEKEKSNLKLKIDLDFKKIKDARDKNDSFEIKNYELLIQKYKIIEKTIFNLKNSLNKQIEILSSNEAKSIKMKCQNQFSEEAIEKICLIDKVFSISCNKALNGYMKHLKD